MNKVTKWFSAFLLICTSVGLNADVGNVLSQSLSVSSPDVKLVDYTFPELVEGAGQVLTAARIDVEKGEITERTVHSILAAFIVMNKQAIQYCSFVQDKMGDRKYMEQWPLLEDIELRGKIDNFRNDLAKESIIPDNHKKMLTDFCQKYETKTGSKTQLFSNPDKLFNLVRECRKDQDCGEFGDVCVDFSKYGEIERIGTKGFWESVLNFFSVGYSSRKKYYTEIVPANETNIVEYLMKIRDKKGYSYDVIDCQDGPYRKPYNDLARAARLLAECRNIKWCGLDWSDEKKMAIDRFAEKLIAQAQNVLKEMEGTYVNFPLLFEISEAISICAFLEYIDRYDERDLRQLRIIGYDEKTEMIRKSCLHEAETVGELCSSYIRHSTLSSVREHAKKYNYVLPWVYATNRVEFARSENDIKVIFKQKYKPKFYDNEENLVKAGEFILDNRNLREKIKGDMLPNISADSLFRSYLEGVYGSENITNWCLEVERKVNEDILYPDWCDDLRKFLNNDMTKGIEQKYDEWNSGEAKKVVSLIREISKGRKAQTLGEKVKDIIGVYVHPMESFYNTIKNSSTISDIESSILYQIDIREETQETKDIHKEKVMLARKWIQQLKSSKNMEKVSRIVDKEISPTWKRLLKTKPEIAW